MAFDSLELMQASSRSKDDQNRFFKNNLGRMLNTILQQEVARQTFECETGSLSISQRGNLSVARRLNLNLVGNNAEILIDERTQIEQEIARGSIGRGRSDELYTSLGKFLITDFQEYKASLDSGQSACERAIPKTVEVQKLEVLPN